jgi:HAD superfamily hydrolase (TIGR01509 family)
MTYAAIFDLDGTLIDSPNAIVTMMGNALAEMGRDPPDTAVIRATIGLPLEAGAAQILGVAADDRDVAQLVGLYRRQFLDWMVPKSRDLLFDGVEDGLRRLRQDGALLGLATSKYLRSAEAVLRSAGIRDLFSAVAGSDSVVRQKPDKEMAEHVAAALGCTPDRCVMIGDTIHDLKMGNAAGMRTVGVSYGVSGAQDLHAGDPAAVADSFPEVVSILGTLEAQRTTLLHI